MTGSCSDELIDRVLWIGYTTYDEAVAKGIYVPGEPWTYELQVNFGRAFSRVCYAVPFGKSDAHRVLTPEITYCERGRLFPRAPKAVRFILELWAAIHFLSRIAKETNPQVVQVCGPNLPALLVWLVPRLWRVPKMCFIEAFWETLLSNQNYMPRALRVVMPHWYKFVYRIFDGYCGTPSLDPNFYLRRGMSRSKIYPWVQSVDVRAIAALDAAKAAVLVHSAPRPRIVSSGRLHPEKLSDEALETFIHLVRKGFTGSLVLVGDGPLREELVRRAREAGVSSRLLITGQLPFVEAATAVKACDLYLATMQGSALLEAMASGLPIVAYNHETHRAMLSDNVTGLLVQDRDPVAAAAALEALTADPGLAARLGANAAATVFQRYNPERVSRILAEPLRAVARGQHAEEVA